MLDRLGKTALVLALSTLSFLTVLAWEFDYFSWDLVLVRAIQAEQLGPFEELLIGLSWLGTGHAPWIVAAVTGFAVLLINPLFRRWVYIFWAGLGAGALLMVLIKEVTARPRPSLPMVHVLVEYSGFSYPSGHVMFYVQYFGFLYLLVCRMTDRLLLRRLSLVILGLPVVLVGYSRVLMGAHWPSDVVGGYLLGGVLLALMVCASRPPEKIEQISDSPDERLAVKSKG
jgi:undecaprenyl-diphosphatase